MVFMRILMAYIDKIVAKEHVQASTCLFNGFTNHMH